MSTAPAEAFFARLDPYLGARGLTLGKLEKAAGCGRTTLYRARERGNVPGLDTVLAICRHLDIAPADLLGDDTPPELHAPAAAEDTLLRRIPLLQLTASHLNPRRDFDPVAIAELADSIAARGLLQNLVVRRDAEQPIWWIVAGERRLRAIEQLAREDRLPPDLADGIPCRVVDATDAEHIALAIIENLQRVEVNPMDQAEAIARLHELDPAAWSTRSIADALGCTQRVVQIRLQLVARLTETAKRELRAGTITLAHAKSLMLVKNREQQDEFVLAAADQTPESLQDDVCSGMFEAKYALFDVAASGLETITLRDEELLIVDRGAALEHQRTAMMAKRDRLLADGAEFVEISRGFIDEGDYSDGGTGVVMRLNGWTGEVLMLDGRRRRKASEPPSEILEADAPEDAPEPESEPEPAALAPPAPLPFPPPLPWTLETGSWNVNIKDANSRLVFSVMVNQNYEGGAEKVAQFIIAAVADSCDPSRAREAA